jgi:hypothetical protein
VNRVPLSQSLPVQALVLDRLGNVLIPDNLTPLQVGDGPGHLWNAGVGPGGVEGDTFKNKVVSDDPIRTDNDQGASDPLILLPSPFLCCIVFLHGVIDPSSLVPNSLVE